MSHCLPLPPFWKKMQSPTEIEYSEEESGLIFKIHPCEIYIYKLLQYIRLSALNKANEKHGKFISPVEPKEPSLSNERKSHFSLEKTENNPSSLYRISHPLCVNSETGSESGWNQTQKNIAPSKECVSEVEMVFYDSLMRPFHYTFSDSKFYPNRNKPPFVNKNKNQAEVCEDSFTETNSVHAKQFDSNNNTENSRLNLIVSGILFLLDSELCF
jgi:hypothetical protein